MSVQKNNSKLFMFLIFFFYFFNFFLYIHIYALSIIIITINIIVIIIIIVIILSLSTNSDSQYKYRPLQLCFNCHSTVRNVNHRRTYLTHNTYLHLRPPPLPFLLFLFHFGINFFYSVNRVNRAFVQPQFTATGIATASKSATTSLPPDCSAPHFSLFSFHPFTHSFTRSPRHFFTVLHCLSRSSFRRYFFFFRFSLILVVSLSLSFFPLHRSFFGVLSSTPCLCFLAWNR